MVAVIVGGSVAGTRTLQALRRLRYPDRIVLLSDEAELPYDRPPLSKAILSGKLSPERISLLRDADVADDNVSVRLGTRAERVDAARHEVELADGERLSYDHLVVATGSYARPAPWGGELPVLRTLDDARRLRERLHPGLSLVIIGGGFIGSEVAATASELGVSVAVVDPLVAPIARIVGDELGARIAGLHRANGVHTKFGAGVAAVESAVAGFEVHLTDESMLVADVVLVGIGARPNDSWLAESGLPTADGVLCDAQCRVDGQADVFAAGDVARWTHPRHGERTRIEHWTNAVEQAECVATGIVAPDDAPAYAPVEYVWSEQYGHKIQIVGRPAAGQPVFVEADPGRYGVLYEAADRTLVGAVTVNWPRAMLAARSVLTTAGSLGQTRDAWVALGGRSEHSRIPR